MSDTDKTKNKAQELKGKIKETVGKAVGDDILLKLPHVRESKSYIVMEEVKESLSLPIPD